MTIIGSISSLGKISKNQKQTSLNEINNNNNLTLQNGMAQGSDQIALGIVSGPLKLVGGLVLVLGFIVGAIGL